MTSPISIDHLTATTTTTTTTTATTNHHDINIDIALLANSPSNTRRNSLSMNGFDSTPTTATAMPFMFSPHYSRQSSSIPVPTSIAASNSDHLLSYPTPDFAPSTIASSNPFSQNHATPKQNNGASLLTTSGEAQVAKTVVIDNLLEKVIRTTQDARDAFSQSRSQDGKQRLAELKAIVDLVVSFASSSAGSSKHSPPAPKPFVPVMDPHSHSHAYHHPHPLPAHSHPFGTHHPFQFQPPSQRVSPAPVKKSSSSSRKSSLSGPIPQLLPLSSTTTGAVAPAALEDASRKRCGSPQNDRAVVKCLKMEPKEEPLLPSLAVNNTTATFADGASPLSSSSSAGSTVPPQLIHSKTYPSASGFHSHPHLHPHPHSHPHSHSQSHSHSHQHAHQHTHSHELAPLSRISSHPSLDSLASSTSISHAALAHQLNFMHQHQQQQQQQQQQHHTMPIPLEHAAHTHSLSTSHVPTMQSHSHSSFLPTTTNGHGHMQASMASGSDSSLLQSPISVPSSAGSSTPNQPRFHLHPNPSLSALPIPHGGTGSGTGHPPMTRPTRSASHSGALSFSSFDLLSSAGAGAGAGSSPGATTTSNSSPNGTAPTTAADVVIDMAGLIGGAGMGSAIELPPRPSSSSAANSSSPGSEREDSPGRLYAAAFSGAGGAGPAAGTSMAGGGVRATDAFVTTTHQNNELSLELKAEVDRIFFEFMNMVCSDLDAKDNKGEPIHQPLMAKKMQRLDESRDFRPFKFRIQAFTNGFLEELAKQGLTDDIIPMKKVRHYLWTNPYISRFNEDGKKAKSKGNHIWNIDAQKAMLPDGGGAGGKAGGQGQWIFRPFKRKIAGTFPNIAYIGIHWQFRPRVWDPQASRSNLHHHNHHHHHSNQRQGHGQDHHGHNHHQPIRFSSPSLPPWLGWNESGDTLSGTPDSDAQSVEFIIEAKEGEETVLSQTYFLSVAPLTREGSTTFHSCNSMPSASVSGSRNTPIVNDLRVPEPSAPSLLSTRSVAASTSTPAALRDALDVVTEAIKAVSLEACTVQASSHAEQVQIQHSLSRQGQVLTSTAHAMNCVMTIASGQHSPSSAADHGGVGGAAVGTEYDAESGEVKDSQTRIEEAASLARAGTDVVICAAQKVAADHHRSAAATILQMSSTGGGISELESMELQNLNLNLNLNAPIVTMEELSTTTKSAVAEAVERTETTASPIDVMLAAETIIQQNTQPLAVSVAVPPLLATSSAVVAPPPFSLHGHGHNVVGVIPLSSNSLASPFDMSSYDYPMNDMTSS